MPAKCGFTRALESGALKKYFVPVPGTGPDFPESDTINPRCAVTGKLLVRYRGAPPRTTSESESESESDWYESDDDTGRASYLRSLEQSAADLRMHEEARARKVEQEAAQEAAKAAAKAAAKKRKQHVARPASHTVAAGGHDSVEAEAKQKATAAKQKAAMNKQQAAVKAEEVARRIAAQAKVARQSAPAASDDGADAVDYAGQYQRQQAQKQAQKQAKAKKAKGKKGKKRRK
jgi:colicin import membrane protein